MNVLCMENPITEIYDRLKKAVQPLCKNTSMSYTETQAKFPYFYVSMVGMPTMDKDLEGDEASILLSIQCESFANGNGALNKAFKIDSLSHQEMINMGFAREFGAQEMMNSDKTIKRVVSRYTRVFAYGDKL